MHQKYRRGKEVDSLQSTRPQQMYAAEKYEMSSLTFGCVCVCVRVWVYVFVYVYAHDLRTSGQPW